MTTNEIKKIWLPPSFDEEFKSSMTIALHSAQPPPLPPRPIDSPQSNSSSEQQQHNATKRQSLQCKLEQFRERMDVACDYVYDMADEKMKKEELESNLISSDAGPMYYQSWLLVNISGDRFERYWVAMENDILYLCRKPTTTPSNYDDVVAAYVQLRSGTTISVWESNGVSSSPSSYPRRKNTRNLSVFSTISNRSKSSSFGVGEDEIDGKEEDAEWENMESSPFDLMGNNTPTSISSGITTILLAPVRISSVSKSTPHFRGEVRASRKHILIRDSGGTFENVLRTNLCDMKRFTPIDMKDVQAVTQAMNLKLLENCQEEENEKEENEKEEKKQEETTTTTSTSDKRQQHWNYMSLTSPHTKQQFELLLSIQRPPFPKFHQTVYKVRVYIGIPRCAETGKSRRSSSVQYIRLAETIPVVNTRSFPGSVLIEIEDKHLSPELHARLRFDVIRDNQYVSRRFEAYVCSILRRRDTLVLLHSPRIDPHVRLTIQVLPPMFTKPRLLGMFRHMAQTYRVPTYTGCDLLCREECAEPHVTFLVPSLYLRLRAKEMRGRLEACRERYSKMSGSKWVAWRESYLSRFQDVVDRYERERDEYMIRYRNIVPYRSSKQKKKGTEIAERLRSVPLNLHLQLLTVAPFSCSSNQIPATRRHGIISWGTCFCSSHSFFFDN
jgi:hypothetical protein